MLNVRSSIPASSTLRYIPGALLHQNALHRTNIKRCTCKRVPADRSATQHASSVVRHAARRCRSILVPSAASDSPLSSTAAAEPDASSTADDGSVLQDLLAWLVNNGVTGIGHDDSRVALYQDADGDRGIIAVEDIPEGAELVRVPLRLAITDVMDDEQRSQLVKQGSYWQDRLVANLLREVQQGRQSAWYPYIRALPKSVPSAVNTFTASEALEVQVPSVTATIQGHADKMAASWQACRPDAISGADLQTYRWAHSCVMSRTFGNAAQGGGIGVRMMVPLIDMLNHAGDETESGLLFDTPIARDNVRWDIVSPDNSPNNCWEMVLSSTQPIPAESSLLLSYFEGSNEEFLLYYGFVPSSNPHDSVELFKNITEALEHLWWMGMSQGKAATDLAPIYKKALDAGVDVLQQQIAAVAADADDGDDWGQLLDVLEPIKITSGRRISNPLAAALEVIHSDDRSAVFAAIAGLAWQQLQAMPSSLLFDLAVLVIDGGMIQDEEAVQQYSRLLRHYAQALIQDYEPQLCQQLADAAAAGGARYSGDTSSTQPPAAATTRRKKAVPGPPAPAAGGVDSDSSSQAPQFIIDQMPFQKLCLSVFTWGVNSRQRQGPKYKDPSSGVLSEKEGHGSLLTHAERLAMQFRVSKKMLLADVIVEVRTPLEVLQQQQQWAENAAAMRAECAGENDSLPWEQ